MRLNSLGWLLWVFAALAIALPFWIFWPGGHPLANANRFDLCPRIRASAEALQPRPDGVAGPNADEARANTGFCRLRFPPALRASGESEVPQVTVLMNSQRTFSNGDPRARTERFMEVNIKEMKASGMAPEPIKGPWRTGVVVSSRGGKSFDVHIEDEGVLLLVATKNLPREDVVQFATAVAKALRQRG